jgi:hypothetical protein
MLRGVFGHVGQILESDVFYLDPAFLTGFPAAAIGKRFKVFEMPPGKAYSPSPWEPLRLPSKTFPFLKIITPIPTRGFGASSMLELPHFYRFVDEERWPDNGFENSEDSGLETRGVPQIIYQGADESEPVNRRSVAAGFFAPFGPMATAKAFYFRETPCLLVDVWFHDRILARRQIKISSRSNGRRFVITNLSFFGDFLHFLSAALGFGFGSGAAFFALVHNR